MSDVLPRIRYDGQGWPWQHEGAHATDLAPTGAPLPTIGIVMPSFNQARFLEEAIRSVLLQNYPSLEFIVMDGGSTDDSVAILRAYESCLTSWTSAADGGQSDAIDRGFTRLQRATVYAWLNSDDMLLPGALHAVGAFFAATPACEWLTGDGVFAYEPQLLNRREHRAGPYETRDLLRYGSGSFLPQPSVFFSGGLYRRAGGVDRGLRYSMDLDLWLRMSRHARLHHLPQSLSVLRQHADAKTLRDNDRAMTEIEAVVRTHARGVLRRDQLLLAVAAIRRRRAGALCCAALDAYFAADRLGAWQSLARAGALYPPIAFTRVAARPLLRLTLPHRLKARILQRP